jgi:hypothetical protein
MASPPRYQQIADDLLTHNHTVIEVVRTSFTEDETPIRVTITVFPLTATRSPTIWVPCPVAYREHRLSLSRD